ncbi:hypothetical protein JCGZ_01303 [Jatropha curcas]|uniref:WIYLD domain-containing protein n=1 Tax=Jatropha curcas TaxID=180498 RepID=A0A067LC66_JATCU|nr:uncharacterized protein LOC105646445 [Jatropha curcas]KDP44803.1 hypothetical protein JCGZ_01303 [Jatropha curcas]
MAPRRRPKMSPKGQLRRDAALDAMRSYGFPLELINITINDLLDVYGLEGWPFIEEASYKVLLDNILEKIEKEAMERSDCKGGNDVQALAAGPSNGGSIPECCSGPDIRDENAIQLHSNVAMDTASVTNEIPLVALQIEKSESYALVPVAEGEASSWKDINLDQDSKKKQLVNAEATEDRNFQAVEKLGSSSHSARYDIGSRARVDALPSRRRRPCYGWISSNDDEDLMELTPAPLPEKIAKLLYGSRSRKRRWDIRPEDM